MSHPCPQTCHVHILSMHVSHPFSLACRTPSRAQAASVSAHVSRPSTRTCHLTSRPVYEGREGSRTARRDTHTVCITSLFRPAGPPCTADRTRRATRAGDVATRRSCHVTTRSFRPCRGRGGRGETGVVCELTRRGCTPRRLRADSDSDLGCLTAPVWAEVVVRWSGVESSVRTACRRLGS